MRKALFLKFVTGIAAKWRQGCVKIDKWKLQEFSGDLENEKRPCFFPFILSWQIDLFHFRCELLPPAQGHLGDLKWRMTVFCTQCFKKKLLVKGVFFFLSSWENTIYVTEITYKITLLHYVFFLYFIVSRLVSGFLSPYSW